MVLLSSNLKWLSANSFSLEESELCRLSKGLVLDVTQKLKFAVGMEENIIGKGEIPPFPTVFLKVFLPKGWIMWLIVNISWTKF